MKRVLAIVLACGLVLGSCLLGDEDESEETEVEEDTVEETEDPPQEDVSESGAEGVETQPEPTPIEVPTKPWIRLPVTEEIPVNADVDLPQDI